MGYSFFVVDKILKNDDNVSRHKFISNFFYFSAEALSGASLILTKELFNNICLKL